MVSPVNHTLFFQVRPVRLMALLVFAVVAAEGSRILMLAPTGGKSQKQLFYGLANGLVSRGHEVVFFNGFKPSSPVKGIREVVPDELAKVFADENYPNIFKMNQEGMHKGGWDQFRFVFVDGPKAALASKELDQLLKEDFDVVILGMFCYPFYFVPYLLKKPFIFLTPLSYSPMQTNPSGNPTLPALHPIPLLPLTEKMSFLSRVQNVVAHSILIPLIQLVYVPYCDQLVAEKFGSGVIPPAAEIEKNVSLVLLNSNPAVHYHTPLLPNVIQVGGMHCAKPKPLPKELSDFLGDSEFIFFSLGSVVKPRDMSSEQNSAILAALGSLPFKVLLKWDTTNHANIPANILPSKWLPQQDILGDSKCRLFISHGGFASVLESLCHGVPMVMLPVSGDHQFHAANAVALGVAEMLTWDALTPESLSAAITTALSPEHLSAASFRRQLMESQPVPPRDLAVHWVEHVIRHGGAPHLRSVGADLNFFQYYSLDVLAFLLVVVLLLLKLLVAMVKCCCRCVCGRRASQAPAEPKAKGKRAKRD